MAVCQERPSVWGVRFYILKSWSALSSLIDRFPNAIMQPTNPAMLRHRVPWQVMGVSFRRGAIKNNSRTVKNTKTHLLLLHLIVIVHKITLVIHCHYQNVRGTHNSSANILLSQIRLPRNIILLGLQFYVLPFFG